METNTIIRAWKDASFRASLGGEQGSKIPGNPAGERSIDAAALARSGGQERCGEVMRWTITSTFVSNCCG